MFNVLNKMDVSVQCKDLLVKINQLENENGHLKRLNVILVELITALEHELRQHN